MDMSSSGTLGLPLELLWKHQPVLFTTSEPGPFPAAGGVCIENMQWFINSRISRKGVHVWLLCSWILCAWLTCANFLKVHIFAGRQQHVALFLNFSVCGGYLKLCICSIPALFPVREQSYKNAAWETRQLDVWGCFRMTCWSKGTRCWVIKWTANLWNLLYLNLF